MQKKVRRSDHGGLRWFFCWMPILQVLAKIPVLSWGGWFGDQFMAHCDGTLWMPASSIFHPNSDEFQFLEILIDGEVLLSAVALAGFGFIGAAGTSRTVVPGMLEWIHPSSPYHSWRRNSVRTDLAVEWDTNLAFERWHRDPWRQAVALEEAMKRLVFCAVLRQLQRCCWNSPTEIADRTLVVEEMMMMHHHHDMIIWCNVIHKIIPWNSDLLTCGWRTAGWTFHPSSLGLLSCCMPCWLAQRSVIRSSWCKKSRNDG